MIPVSFQLTVLLKKNENALIGVSILKNKKIDRISIGSIIEGNFFLQSVLFSELKKQIIKFVFFRLTAHTKKL